MYNNSDVCDRMLAIENICRSASKGGAGKIMALELKMEVTEDAAPLSIRTIIQYAFRLSLCAHHAIIAVHRVILEKESVEISNENGTTTQVLAAVYRVTPYIYWDKMNPGKFAAVLAQGSRWTSSG